MLREKVSVIKKAILLLDGVVVVISFLLSFLIRIHIPPSFGVNLLGYKIFADELPTSLNGYFILIVFAVPLWCLILYWQGVYRAWPPKSKFASVRAVAKSALLVFIMISTVVFVLQLKYVSRLLILLFIIVSFFLILIEKILMYEIIQQARRKGLIIHRILVVGKGARAMSFIRMIKGHPEWGRHIVGAIDDEPGSGTIAEVERVPVIGNLDGLGKILMNQAVDEVFFVLPRSRLDHIENAVRECETVGVLATVAVDLFNVELAKCRHSELAGVPFVSFDTVVAKETQLLIKRTSDLALSGVGILVVFPLLVLIGLLVKLTSRGPVLFRQRRAGLNGRIFMLYKFRTMYNGADQLRMDMEPLNEMGGPVFKIKMDPRVTPLGRFLRKFSLDELPQLFNVLSGHMSLIGPRALATYEAEKIKPWQRRRQSMRPGLTGLWQISGRNNVDFTRWMEMDLEYLDNWSIWLDLKIILKTIPIVFFGIGAY